MNIRYQSTTVPIAIDGPCPECGQRLELGDSITIGPPVRHRACDPTAIAFDAYIDRVLANLVKSEDAS